MLDRASLDRRLSELEDAVHGLLARIDALEGRAAPGAAAASTPSGVLNPAGPAPPRGLLGFSGRTFIVLGGAFLLRAVSESGMLPAAIGAWLGLAYAVVWLAAADRTRGLSALFHGFAALIIALPLIAESAARFGFLSAADGTLALIGIGALALGVAWHRRMPALAGAAVAGSLATAIVMAIATGGILPGAVVVLALGLLSLWIGYDAGWRWIAWPGAAAANLLVLASVARAIADPPREAPGGTLVVLAVLTLGYLGSFALRNLFHERSIRTFEIAQTAAVVAIGIAGALAVGRRSGYDPAFVAVPSLTTGLLLYVQAFTRVLPRRGHSRTTFYHLSLAFALTAIGVALLLPAGPRPPVMAALALALTLAGWRLSLPILSLHGAIAAVIASAQSGLLAAAWVVWLRPATAWPDVTPAIVVVFVVLAACYAMPRPAGRRDADDVVLGASRAMVGTIGVWAFGAMLVAAASAVGAGEAGLTTIRTLVLAAAAVLLARARQMSRTVELGWLTYPVLAAGLAKILLDDLGTAEPWRLMVAFVAYGASLTAASRMARR